MEEATIFNFARMCRNHERCESCPLGVKVEKMNAVSCGELIRKYTDKTNEIILNWCKEHPVKTRQSEFLKMFPNAKIINGAVAICPKKTEGYCLNKTKCNCDDCYKSYWLAEVE